MKESIIEFIEGQKVISICCVDENNLPYCFSSFYAFDREQICIYFKSSVDTHHIELLLRNNAVAGTIQPDKLNPMAIKGIQFTGTMLDRYDDLSSHAKTFYHTKYPFAVAVPGKVWTISLDFIKMTDNTLSFGKKITWRAQQEAEA